jgi:hypothetical protein
LCYRKHFLSDKLANITMKVIASLLLAAIPISSFVDADAFVTPSHGIKSPMIRQTVTKAPLTPVGRLNNNSCSARGTHSTAAPLSNIALGMSGGGGGEAVSTEGTATIPDEIFNLVKSIVGAGVLSLPAGAYHSSVTRTVPIYSSNIRNIFRHIS